MVKTAEDLQGGGRLLNSWEIVKLDCDLCLCFDGFAAFIVRFEAPLADGVPRRRRRECAARLTTRRFWIIPSLPIKAFRTTEPWTSHLPRQHWIAGPYRAGYNGRGIGGHLHRSAALLVDVRSCFRVIGITRRPQAAPEFRVASRRAGNCCRVE